MSDIVCTTASGCGKREGFKYDEESEMWVCVVCSRPAPMYLESWLKERGFYG